MWSAFKFFMPGTGYDAVKDRQRRRPPRRRVLSQDRHLASQSRDAAIATTQDAQRNFGLVAWMIRKHLDFVASFRFQARTENEAFNVDLERYMADYQKPYNCDVRGRHSLRRIIRLAEATRCVSGDVFLQKIHTGRQRGMLQAIEPDLVRQPERYTQDFAKAIENQNWINGVRVDRNGRSLQYAVCRRGDSGEYVFDRFLRPRNVFSLGYYERFDQIRGVSPFLSSLNSVADLYESFDMSFMKIKLSAAFGLFIYRDSNDPLDGTSATVDSDGDGINDSGYEWDAGAGVYNVELSTDDKAEVIESKSPAVETVNFLQLMADFLIKALDLPIGFLDESRSNFSGSRAGLVLYEKACDDKRADLIDLLDRITEWRVGMAIADGELRLPQGMQFADLNWEWVPSGTAWYDPQKEVAGLKNAIGAHLDNFERAARSRGTDYYENVDINARAIEYARERGVDPMLATTVSAQQTVDPDGTDADQEPVDDASQPEMVTDEN